MAYLSTERVKARLSASRERIIAATPEIMAGHGYAGCSVAAVAERASVATGSFYRHVPTKAGLSAEVFRTASQREVDAVARAAALRGIAEGPASACTRTGPSWATARRRSRDRGGATGGDQRGGDDRHAREVPERPESMD